MLIIIEVPHTLQNVNFAAKERVLKSAFHRVYKTNQLKKPFLTARLPFKYSNHKEYLVFLQKSWVMAIINVRYEILTFASL